MGEGGLFHCSMVGTPARCERVPSKISVMWTQKRPAQADLFISLLLIEGLFGSQTFDQTDTHQQ